jgi:hypothetical protein
MTEILSIKIRANSDALLWTASSSGSFTTKSAHHLYTSRRPLQSSPVISTSWKGLWKMVWNIVPTKDRISLSINSMLDTSCSLCSHSIDSLLHLFFSCPIARVIWRNSFWPLDITALRISTMSDWLNIICIRRL